MVKNYDVAIWSGYHETAYGIEQEYIITRADESIEIEEIKKDLADSLGISPDDSKFSWNMRVVALPKEVIADIQKGCSIEK